MEQETRFSQRYFMHKRLKVWMTKFIEELFLRIFQLKTWWNMRREGPRRIKRYWSKIAQQEKSKEEWFSMEKKLESGCKYSISKVPRHYWRPFLNNNNRCAWGERYHGSGCYQKINSEQHSTKKIWQRKGNNENNRYASGYASGTVYWDVL